MEELLWAICSGSVKKIRLLPISKLTFTKKNMKGFTPLLLAARTLGPVYTEVYYDTKKKLYSANLGDGEQMCALHFACFARDRNFVLQFFKLCIELEFVDIAHALLRRGADVSIASPYGLTAIFMAEGKYADGQPRVHSTPYYQDASVVKILLRYGANLSIMDHFDESHLHKAFCEADDEVVTMMLEVHSQCLVNPVNANGFSHLHIACNAGRVIKPLNALVRPDS